MHEPAKARFERGVLDGELPGNEAVGLLDAKRVHRPDPEGAKVVISPRLHQPVEEVILHFDRVVQLPPQLSDEVEAERARMGRADVDGASAQPPKVRIGKRRIGKPLEELARLRTGNHKHAVAGGRGLEADTSVGGKQLAQRIEVVALEGSRRHQVEAVGRFAVYRELRANPAVGGEQVAEPDPADAGGNAIREQAVEPRFRPRPRHLALRERAHVEQPHLLVDVAALGPHMLEVVAAPEAPHILRLHGVGANQLGRSSRRPARIPPPATSCANSRAPA